MACHVERNPHWRETTLKLNSPSVDSTVEDLILMLVLYWHHNDSWITESASVWFLLLAGSQSE